MDLRKERTLKYLSQALADLMREKRLSEISVSEICERAMVRRATFYRHFADKPELLDYVISQQRNMLPDELFLVDSETKEMPLSEYCCALNRRIIGLINANRSLIKLQHDNAYFATKVRIIAETISGNLSQRLAKQRGESEPSATTITIAKFYTSGIIGCLATWAISDEDLDGERILITLDGITARVFS